MYSMYSSIAYCTSFEWWVNLKRSVTSGCVIRHKGESSRQELIIPKIQIICRTYALSWCMPLLQPRLMVYSGNMRRLFIPVL